MNARVQKWGNSLAVRIPKSVASEAGLKQGAPVEISVDGGRVIVAPRRDSYVLKDLVAGITAENRHDAADFGKPFGRETW
jgi:antitoxin MazE